VFTGCGSELVERLGQLFAVGGLHFAQHALNCVASLPGQLVDKVTAGDGERERQVALLSEEYDPVNRRQLGNTPQAFSMVELINTARHLSGTPTVTSARRHEQGLNQAAD